MPSHVDLATDTRQVIDDKAHIHLGASTSLPEFLSDKFSGLILTSRVAVMWIPGPEHIKAYMKMILEGVGFLHRNWVLHRFVRHHLRALNAHIESSVQQVVDLALWKLPRVLPHRLR